ncbi:hypothetical protein [Absidia glauca]|uniref:Uncharacterized protein n=1 Tax=Absidia glauca TaxID=4829 RepID=A0A168KWI6_ABSGL|nr:hypothetical protein [Absidia glauca]
MQLYNAFSVSDDDDFLDDEMDQQQALAMTKAIKRQAPVKQERKFKYRNRADFARRFQMDRQTLLRIVGDVERQDAYFQQRCDAAGRPGFTALQKVASAIRQLAYGATSDAFDDYFKMGTTTQLECLRNFCDVLVDVYGQEYLRKPSVMNLLT